MKRAQRVAMVGAHFGKFLWALDCTSALTFIKLYSRFANIRSSDDIKPIEHNELPIRRKLGECVRFTAKHYYPLESGRPVVWQKYAFALQTENFTYLREDNKTLIIGAVTAQDSALYSVELSFRIPGQKRSGREGTRYWLTVQGMRNGPVFQFKNKKTRIQKQFVCG